MSEEQVKKKSLGWKKLTLITLVVIGCLRLVKLQVDGAEEEGKAPTPVTQAREATVPAVKTMEGPVQAAHQQGSDGRLQRLVSTVDALSSHPNFQCSNGIEGPYGVRTRLSMALRALAEQNDPAATQFLNTVVEDLRVKKSMGCF